MRTRTALLAFLVACSSYELVRAAEYRVTAAMLDVLPGETVPLAVQVQTEANDNVVDIGHWSFAIDLALSGSAGAAGDAIGNVVINTAAWDDTLSNKIGIADGVQFTGTGGVCTDAFAPNFGAAVGEVVGLFTFDLVVPAAAAFGDTIIVTPSEGFLQNLTVSEWFAPVAPQNFAPAVLTIVPEPVTLVLVAVGLLSRLRRR